MKYAHSIKLNVFSYENENREKILNSFLKFFPFNIEENKIELNTSIAKGFNESAIAIFEIVLTKPNLINCFLEFILNNLSQEQKQTILKQSESRLDGDFNFFVRFDKDEWINNNKLELTDSGKCFHLRMSVAAFPRKREVALNIVKELFYSNEKI